MIIYVCDFDLHADLRGDLQKSFFNDGLGKK